MSNLMFDYIPGYFKETKLFKALLDTELVQFDKVDALIADCINQLYVDTATWGLSLWERDYELEYNPELTIEQRRSRVKAKIRGTGKVTGGLIKRVASSFNDDQGEVTFDGKINIELTRKTTNALSLKDLQEALEEIIPAHLDYTLAVKYVAVAAIKSELMVNIPSELVHCGRLVSGAYPDENTAKENAVSIRLETLYSMAEQLYRFCGTFACGDSAEIVNDAKSMASGINLTAVYATAQQTYPVCGQLTCGEVLT